MFVLVSSFAASAGDNSKPTANTVVQSGNGYLESKSDKVEHYFNGTNYQVDVYYFYGKNNGTTALITGGIQGDEPGGFLSADYYLDKKLETGNLIIIPRLNLKSIIMFDRGPDGDMNRQFRNVSTKAEENVVKLVKSLMNKADLFINLHDGYGYHRDIDYNWTYSSDRFGQSIIIDENSFTCSKAFGNKKIDLLTPAQNALNYANDALAQPQYNITLFNTHTFSNDTKFLDMRDASTYYVLNNRCIPAFAVESSKNIKDLKLRVLTHVYPVNYLLSYYGVKFEDEGVNVELPQPTLSNIVIKVDEMQLVAESNSTVFVPKGSNLTISNITSNYPRGNTCDIDGLGGYNDAYYSTFNIKRDTTITCRKDYSVIGSVKIVVTSDLVASVEKSGSELAGRSSDIVEEGSVKPVIANSDETHIMVGSSNNVRKTTDSLSDDNSLVDNNDTVSLASTNQAAVVSTTDNAAPTSLSTQSSSTQTSSSPSIIGGVAIGGGGNTCSDKVVVSKPNNSCGVVGQLSDNVSMLNLSSVAFLVVLNNNVLVVPPEATLNLRSGDQFYIAGMTSNEYNDHLLYINFQGYIPHVKLANNNGDDRFINMVINKSQFRSSYSVGYNLYPVKARFSKFSNMQFYVKLVED